VSLKIIPDRNGKYNGAFVADDISERSVIDFEKKTGERLDVALKFLAFSTGLNFPLSEAKIMASRKGALFIKLEPWSWKGKGDRSFSLDDILDGKCDQLLERFARGAKAFGKAVFVSFAHEMNANWYPWSGDPEKYKQAYQYVHDRIESYGAKNITWVWNPDVSSSFNDYYPGDRYVDWIALDGYNTQDYGAPWKNFKELFGSALDNAAKFGKSIMIGEFASDANDGTDEGNRKPEFLRNAIDFMANDKRIRAFIYFDADKIEEGEQKHWSLDTPESIKAYRQAMHKYESLFRSSILTDRLKK
jgi:beta-mannanase